MTMHRAALKIRSAFNMFVAKKELELFVSRRDSCILIQKTWRGFKDQKDYFQAIRAVFDLQKATRGFLVRKTCREKLIAALTIQQAWWDWVSHWETHAAAVAIQKAWRGSQGRNHASALALRRGAACTIQTVWRGHFQLTLYTVFVESAILLQKVVRGHLSRKAFHLQQFALAAQTIQSAWRSFSAQVKFQIDLLDIISIQTLFRCRQAKRERESRNRSVATLQSAFRCALARRVHFILFDEKQKAMERESAALTCQVSRPRKLSKS
jgi:myosin heavy subunit